MLPFADGSDLGASVRNPAAFCNLVGLRPTPGRIPTLPPGRPLGPVRRPRADRAHRAGRGAAARGARRPRSARSALDRQERVHRELRAGHRRSDRLEPRPGRPADRPRGDRGAGVAARDAHRPRLRRRGRRAGLRRAPTSASRSCAAVGFAGAFGAIVDEVKPTLAENTRFGLSLRADRIARALELRGEMFTRMREFLTGYDVLAGPVTAVPAFDVETEYPTEVAGVPMGSYLEWFRTCSRITVTAHPVGGGPGRVHATPGSRSASSSSAATAASSRCCGSRTRSTARPGCRTGRRRSDAVAHDAADGRAPRRLRRRRAAPVLADHAARGVARAHRRHRRRPVHRRRRLHGPVGGALRQGARSRARRRPARGRDGRLRRQRAQRRVRDRVAHARDRQRARALRGRDAGAGAAGAGELRRPGRRSRPLRDRLRLRGHRRRCSR